MPTPNQSTLTTNSARSVTSIACDLPPNTAAQLLVAVVSASFASGSPGAAFTLTGWTSVVTGSADPAAYTQIFKVAGGITGPITVTVNKTADQISIVVLTVDDADFTPDASSSGSTSNQTSQTLNSLTTTQPNDLLIAGWGVSDGIGNPAGVHASSLMTELVGMTGDAIPYVKALGLAVAYESRASSGATGSRSGQSYRPSDGQPITSTGGAAMVAIKRYAGPSVPLVTYANGGESLTIGAVVTLTCTTATHPTIASSSLQYDFDYSTNNGGSWTNIGLSTAGVASKAWTVPNVPGATNLIRVRAYDGTLYSLAYDQSNAAFTIAAEVAPGAPTISSPSAGSVQVKSAALAIAWVHQGGTGNPQTAFTLQWSRDAFASHTATVGPTTTATQSTTIDVSAEADGATISVKVKTKGVSLYSPYSAVRSFVISTAPATPNITAPTAGSPPTTPTPTVTFTEASTFVARKFRVVRSSVEVYNSGEVSGSGLSFPSPFSFTNGQAVTIYLSVKNTYGLWSAETSQMVTPAYTGPTKPTAVYTVSSTAGNIQIQITNSDSPSYNEIWRYKSGTNRSTAIRITPSLPVSGAYADYSVTSGVTYIYFVRAYNSSGLFTDSDDS